MVDWYGTPHTEALHVVERYRMIDYATAKEGFERDAKEHNVPAGMPVANLQGKYLQLRFTVEDQNVFTTPWSATMTYRYAGNGPLDWDGTGLRRKYPLVPGKRGRRTAVEQAGFLIAGEVVGAGRMAAVGPARRAPVIHGFGGTHKSLEALRLAYWSVLRRP